MQLIVNSLLTNYERDGSGKVVLLLHGWGDSLISFRSSQQQLSRHYDVISLDLPGFGKTDTPKETWGLDNYAAFAGAFMDKLGVVPYAIIAHSNGGAIALRGLHNGSLKTDKLVLLASAGIRSEYKGKKKALRVLAKTGKLLTRPLPKRTRERLRHQAYHAIGSDLFVAEHLQDTFKKVVTDDVQSDAAQIRLPTLLVYGDADEQTPAHYGEILHSLIEHSRLEIIPGGDHFLLLNQPTKVLPLIQGFLRA